MCLVPGRVLGTAWRLWYPPACNSFFPHFVTCLATKIINPQDFGDGERLLGQAKLRFQQQGNHVRRPNAIQSAYYYE